MIMYFYVGMICVVLNWSDNFFTAVDANVCIYSKCQKHEDDFVFLLIKVG